MTLSGRFALVTGAGEGLGAAIAERFIAEGASLLLTSRSPGPLAEVERRLSSMLRGSQQLLAMPLDVSRTADVDAVIAAAMRAFPRLDIVVNNAGIYGPMGRLEDANWSEWVEAISVNLMGTVYTCRAVVPLMRRAGHGKIINISGGGATSPLPYLTAYAAAKAAVVRFSESLALELVGTGIEVNCIAPGALATRMMDQAIAAGAERLGSAFIDRMVRLRKEGATPLAVPAALAAWLASDASDGITGRLISAPWDPWPSLNERRDELRETDIYTLRRVTPGDRGRSWPKA